MRLASQVPRFAVVGLAVTGLHVLVATALNERAGVGPIAANGCAFAMATVASYLANSAWTFGHVPAARSFARFVVVSLAGLALTLGIAGAADGLGYPFHVGLLAVVTVVPFATFAMHRLWTYRVP